MDFPWPQGARCPHAQTENSIVRFISKHVRCFLLNVADLALSYTQLPSRTENICNFHQRCQLGYRYRTGVLITRQLKKLAKQVIKERSELV